MINRARLAVLVSFIWWVLPAGAATIAEVVASRFPASLKVDGAGHPVPASDLESAFVVGDLEHSGHQRIAAVYSNGVDGVVAVLSPDGPGSLVGCQPFSVAGLRPEIRLLDLDRDARPEIVVTFHNVRGPSQVWIYKWNGNALTLLAPVTRHHEVDSDVFEPMFLDADGDGNIDVVDFRRGSPAHEDDEVPASPSYRLMSLRNGQLSVVATLDTVFAALRGTGTPAPLTETFSVTDPSVPRVLVLVNGDVDGKHRVSSAVVTVNGQPIVSERDLNAGVARLEIPIAVKADNTIAAELRGAPDGEITILIMRR